MSKAKKTKQKDNNLVHTVRHGGAIGANIFRGNTPDGHTYLYFVLSRSWMSQTGNRKGYSDRFYSRNAQELAAVVAEAAQWIESHPEAADGDVVANDQNLQAAA